MKVIRVVTETKPFSTVKTILIILLTTATISIAMAQQQLEFFIRGKVYDANTKAPLSSVTIMIKKQGTSYSSDKDGSFAFQVKGSTSDSLMVSHVGYKTILRSINDLKNQETFYLEGHSIQLKTVTVTSRKINMKNVDSSLRSVSKNLFAYETELTNGLYNVFLEYLKEDDQLDLLKVCNYDLSKYNSEEQAFYDQYGAPYKALPIKGDTLVKNYTDYPVVNISHEAAVLFCQWFSEQYNNNPGKKKFKRVQFRLPTLSEWQIAALGYPKFQSWTLDENSVEVVIPTDTVSEFSKGKKTTVRVNSDFQYPWWRAYNYRKKAQNAKNCFLGNFKITSVTQACERKIIAYDGWTKQAPTSTYFNNGIGLYDMVGNVAEMIDEKGKACGGSWKDHPKESTIRSIKYYNKPDESIGFRLFMEVIEE